MVYVGLGVHSAEVHALTQKGIEVLNFLNNFHFHQDLLS